MAKRPQATSSGAASVLLTATTVAPRRRQPVIAERMTSKSCSSIWKTPEPELVTPARLVLDEAELVEQRPDRRLGARQELDVAPPRLELRVEVHLVHLVVGDLADGGERLQRCAVGVVGLRGVEDDPVAARHLAQHVRLAVVGLGESAAHATLTWPRLTVLIQFVMTARYARTPTSSPDSVAAATDRRYRWPQPSPYVTRRADVNGRGGRMSLSRLVSGNHRARVSSAASVGSSPNRQPPVSCIRWSDPHWRVSVTPGGLGILHDEPPRPASCKKLHQQLPKCLKSR